MSIQQVQDYYSEAVHALSFIENEEEAEKVTKACLGILTSELSEQKAREFAAQLPDYLDYETLRGHQMSRVDANVDEARQTLKNQFNFSEEESDEALKTVIGVAKQQASGEISDIAYEMGENWPAYIDSAR